MTKKVVGMSKRRNIYLIGPLGTGKSSVGLKLAKFAQWEFCDTDREIEARCGVDIAWIFDVEGEQGYRQREFEVLQDLSRQQHMVISTGGGTIVSEENRQLISESGLIIYLQVSFTNQLQRASYRIHTRPMMNTEHKDKALRELNAQRMPIYRSLADLTYDTDKMNPHKLAKKIWMDIEDQSLIDA